jgi:hypothetical protein
MAPSPRPVLLYSSCPWTDTHPDRQTDRKWASIGGADNNTLSYSGHDSDDELTRWIVQEWTDSGLEGIRTVEYDFFLSWPNSTDPNRIQLLGADGKVAFESRHRDRVVILE